MKNYFTLLKLKSLTLTLFLFAISVSLQAQLLSWSPSGLSGYGPSPWAPTTSTPNIISGGWTRGAGTSTTGTAAGSAWGGSNWTGLANCDMTFTVTSNPGSVVSYTAFNLFYRRSSSGPASATLEYTFGNSTTYTVINTLSFNNTTSSGAAYPQISLTGVTDLQNVTPGTVVKFRIFPIAGTTTAGTWYIFGTGASLDGNIGGMGVVISQTGSITCNGQTNGQLTASVSGGTGPYTYSWMPSGGTSSVATGLAAGVYTCFVTSSLSETSTATYSLTQPAVISASISAQNSVTCHNGSNGAATITAVGGASVHTYTWMPSGGTASVAGSLSAGVYTVSVSDINNCAGVTQTLSILQPTAPTLFANTSNTAVCSGGTVMLSGSGATTYSWTNGVTNGTAFTPGNSMTYTVTGTNTVTGCTGIDSVHIVVNAPPTITVVSGSGIFATCIGSSLTLNGSGAGAYVWSSGLLDGVAFSPSASAVYSVSGTDPVTTCTAATTVSVTVYALPTITISSASGSLVLCQGSTMTLTAAGAFTYVWNNGVSNSVAFSPSASAVYSVTGTDLNNCSNSAAVSVTVNTLPTLSVHASKPVICAGQAASITVNGAATYSWSNNSTASLIVVSPSLTTTYTISGISSESCVSTVAFTQSVSACLGIESVAGNEQHVMIYPNPNAGEFTISHASDLDLVIVDELGRTVQSLKLNESNEHQVQVKDLSNGIYFILSTGNGAGVKQKIIVSK